MSTSQEKTDSIQKVGKILVVADDGGNLGSENKGRMFCQE